MPYEITREARGAYKRFWGIVTAEEFLTSVRDFHNDRFFETVRYTLNDFAAAERFVLTDSQIEDTAAINLGASYHNPEVLVLAVTTDPVIIAMARKYDRLTQAEPIRIFASLREARAWLAQAGLEQA